MRRILLLTAIIRRILAAAGAQFAAGTRDAANADMDT